MAIASLFFVLAIFIGLISSVFWLWMLIDALTSKNLAGNDKIIWVIVILFLHFVGALIYFFAGRKGR